MTNVAPLLSRLQRLGPLAAPCRDVAQAATPAGSRVVSTLPKAGTTAGSPGLKARATNAGMGCGPNPSRGKLI
jgi:hypothetical protein